MYVAMIMIFMFALAGCAPSAPQVVSPKVDETLIKKLAIKKCTKWKEEEYNWKPEEIKEYCTEMWRGYRD